MCTLNWWDTHWTDLVGHQGVDGVTLRNGRLDECHRHSHIVAWDRERREMYHYHATWEYPHMVGCFRGVVE